MKRKIWLAPRAATQWESLPAGLKTRVRAALELVAAGSGGGTPLTGPLSSLFLCTLEPGIDLIYRESGSLLEVLALYRPDAGSHAAEGGRVVGVVLAAGEGECRGLPLPLVPLGGQPLISHVARTLQAAGVDEVIVVLGYAAEAVKARVELADAAVVVNHRYRLGLASSLRCGLRLAGDAAAVLVTLADRPFLTPASVKKVLARYRQARPPVVLPVYRDRPGHPVLFDRSLLPALGRVRRGGREVVRRYQHQVAAVPVEDEGVVREIG